jgi:hypothetical protein
MPDTVTGKSYFISYTNKKVLQVFSFKEIPIISRAVQNYGDLAQFSFLNYSPRLS